MSSIPRSVTILVPALLVLAPLAFGTTELWSFILLQGLCLLAFCLLLWRSFQHRETFVSAPGSVNLFLLGGYFLSQMLPLPPAALRLLSPGAWRLYGETVWVLSPGVWMPLSVNLKSTCMEFARFWTYGVFYLLAIQVMSERGRLKTLVQRVCLFAGGYALLGILQYLRPTGRIFWVLRDWPKFAPHHFGTYVNGNHYAGLMEMLLPVMLCLFLAKLPQARYGSWRQRLIEAIGNPGSNRRVLFGGAALMAAVSIFLSLSRGGTLSTLTALSALSLFLLLRRNDRKAGKWLLLFMAGALLTVGMFGWEPILARFDRMRNAQGELTDGRLIFWKDSAELVRRFPATGTGFGTFVDVYPTVKTCQVNMTIDRAHNDYVELATDGGLIGILLVAGFFGVVLRRVIPAWRRRKSRFSFFMVLGALTGIAAIGLHSVTDFNLRIGANALYFVWLLALAVAASHNRTGGRTPSELPPIGPRKTLFSGVLLAVGLLAAILFNLGVLTAERRFATVAEVDIAKVQSLSERAAIREVAAFAARLDPLESRYRYALANGDLSLGYVTRALENYARSLRFGLVRGEFLERMGLVYDHLDRPDKARQLFEAAVAADISEPKHYLSLAGFLLKRGDREAAFDVTRKALRIAPGQTRNVLLLLILHRVEDALMVRALPETSRAYLEYGEYLAERGDDQGAEKIHRHSLQLFKAEKAPEARVIWRLRAYFSKNQRYRDALYIVQEGIRKMPKDAALRRAAGELYERLGIPYRAVEEYRQALLLEPGHGATLKRLEALTGEQPPF